MRHNRHPRLSVAAGLIAATLMAGALSLPPWAAAQEPPPLEQIDRDATAALDWSVPARFNASWSAWRPGSSSYDPAVISPQRWSITLDACKSKAVRRIERYTFVVTGITNPNYTRTFDGKPCKRILNRVLPGLGTYRVDVTAHTALGASATLQRVVELRDHLVVSIGDSLASGEGVPDPRGRYVPLPAIKEIRPVRWDDRRCHRSRRSGHSLAARAIENASRHTSVTFISFACSGAGLHHLYDTPYAGQDTSGAKLAPQLDDVRELVGPDAAGGERQIDALIVNGGANDLGFGTVIRACAKNNNQRVGHTDCVTGFAASKLVGKPRFARRYDALANAIRLLAPRETYFSGYPSQVFRGGGCGKVGFPFVGIDAAEGEAINKLGIALNRQIEAATLRHRDEGWNYIEDLTEPFRTHAYCDDDRWFVRYIESLVDQGDERGTAHPNRAGHRAFARLLGRAIVPGQPSVPFRETTLVVDAVKLSAVGTNRTLDVDMRLFRFPRDFGGVTRTIEAVPRNGQWTPVPVGLGTFEVPVFREPASPRHATEVRLVLNDRLPLHHGFQDGYGAGSHVLTHPTGTLAVSYHIDVRDPTGSSPGNQVP